jgi:hypothetical protein
MKLTTIEGATNFLVALDVAGTIAKGDLVETANDLNEGELVLLDDTNHVVDDTDAGSKSKVRFCTLRKGKLRYSDWIYKGDMNFYSGKSHEAATNKVSYLGYNGSTGAMDAANNVEYKIKVIDNTDERLFPSKDMYHMGFWKSTAATQENVASGLFGSLVMNTDYGESFIDIALLNSGAGTTLAAGNTIKVSEGSKVVIIEHATAAETPVVGKYLRFGGAATNLPVYKVASVGGTATKKVVTLEYPYAQETKNFANTEVAKVTTTGANFGLKISTVTRTYFKPGVLSNLNFDFVLGITNFTVATITDASVAFTGSGTYRQMAEMEWYQEGHVASVHRNNGILDEYSMEYMTKPGSTYEQLNIGFFDAGHHTAIGQNPKSMKHLIVAFENDLTAGDSANTAIKAMDAFAAASNGFAASGIAV